MNSDDRAGNEEKVARKLNFDEVAPLKDKSLSFSRNNVLKRFKRTVFSFDPFHSRSKSKPTSPTGNQKKTAKRRKSLPPTPTPRTSCEAINKLNIKETEDKEKLLLHAILGHAAATLRLNEIEIAAENQKEIDRNIQEFRQNPRNARQWEFGGDRTNEVFKLVEKHARYLTDFYSSATNVANFWMCALRHGGSSSVNKYQNLFPYIYLANIIVSFNQKKLPDLSGNIFSEYKKIYGKRNLPREFKIERKKIEKKVLVFSVKTFENPSVKNSVAKFLLRLQIPMLAEADGLNLKVDIKFLVELLLNQNCYVGFAVVMDEYFHRDKNDEDKQDNNEAMIADKMRLSFSEMAMSKKLTQDQQANIFNFICNMIREVNDLQIRAVFSEKLIVFLIADNNFIVWVLNHIAEDNVFANLFAESSPLVDDAFLQKQSDVFNRNLLQLRCAIVLINPDNQIRITRGSMDLDGICNIIKETENFTIPERVMIFLINNEKFIKWCEQSLNEIDEDESKENANHNCIFFNVFLASKLLDRSFLNKQLERKNLNKTNLLSILLIGSLYALKHREDQVYQQILDLGIELTIGCFDIWRDFIVKLSHKNIMKLTVFENYLMDSLIFSGTEKKVKIKILLSFIRVCKVLNVANTGRSYQKKYIAEAVIKPEEFKAFENFNDETFIPMLRSLFDKITKVQMLSSIGVAVGYAHKAAAFCELYLEIGVNACNKLVNLNTVVDSVICNWQQKQRNIKSFTGHLFFGLKKRESERLSFSTYNDLLKYSRRVTFLGEGNKSSDSTAAMKFINEFKEKYGAVKFKNG
jgi:hypothetical protein